MGTCSARVARPARRQACRIASLSCRTVSPGVRRVEGHPPGGSGFGPIAGFPRPTAYSRQQIGRG
jgi:hypothetical protein